MSQVQDAPPRPWNRQWSWLNYGDQVRCHITREALKRELFNSEGVQQLFRQWAAQVGYDDWTEQFREADLRLTEMLPTEARFQRLGIVLRAMGMQREAETYVGQLGWQSPWLARDLRNTFAFHLVFADDA